MREHTNKISISSTPTTIKVELNIAQREQWRAENKVYMADRRQKIFLQPYLGMKMG